MSKNDDLVRRLRALAEAAQKSMDTGGREEVHPFEVQEVCEASLDAIERGAAQGVTDEALRVQYWNALYGHIDAHQGNTSEASARSHASGVVDKAIFEAGEPTPPAPAPDAGERGLTEDESKMLDRAWRRSSNVKAIEAHSQYGDYTPVTVGTGTSPTPQPPAVKSSMFDAFEAEAEKPKQVLVATEQEAKLLAALDEKVAALKAKADEIERLQQQLDEARSLHNHQVRRAEAAEASNKALREGLAEARRLLSECYVQCETYHDERDNLHAPINPATANQIEAFLAKLEGCWS